MNIKNTSSLLLGALFACLSSCASPNSPHHVVDAVFPSPPPFGPPGAPLIIGPLAANVHKLLAGEEQSYRDELMERIAVDAGSKPSAAWDHWNFASVNPRIGRFFFSYDSDRDGPSLLNKMRRDRADVSKTISRMFLNHNPDNPFQG